MTSAKKSVKPKRPPGRPSGRAQADFIGTRASPDLVAAVDKWRAAQPDKPSRSAAVRMLIEMAIASQESPVPSISSTLADDLGSFA